jgi:hypothetical protein
MTGDADGAAVEVEFDVLTEVDAQGRHAAVITSMLTIPRRFGSWYGELQARFVAGEAAASGGNRRCSRSFAGRPQDWEAVDACVAADFVMEDRRATQRDGHSRS